MGCLDSQRGKDKEQRRWKTGGSSVFSLFTGGKQNIDTSAEAQGQVDASYYRAGFDKLRTPPPTKLRRGVSNIMSAHPETKAGGANMVSVHLYKQAKFVLGEGKFELFKLS